MEESADKQERTERVKETSMIGFGDDDHQKFPRVGDGFQAKIPSPISQCEYNSYVAKNKLRGKAVNSETNNGFSRETEEASLLLGLYIFGKDFTQIRKFVGCKSTGHITKLYYGNKFYKSDEHTKWSSSQKAKRKKVVFGKKIFSGFRLEELLSRLSVHISEEQKESLSKASILFGKRKLSLSAYVSTIKSVSGMKSFVEAMAIGKDGKDLTRMIKEPPKKQLVLPGGKTCFSSLTPTEIINFLSGDLQTMKGMSNDIFWEAVWPRLLGGGWNSEQPRCYTGKQSLVFLVPGVTKFSRRMRLVKGVDYFDSIPDVLNKVLSDPSLLELEGETKHSENRDCMTAKFTVVDTSRNMSNGITYSSIREMKLFSDESSSPKIFVAPEEISFEDDTTDSSIGDNNINNWNHTTDAEIGMISGLKESNEGTKEADWSSLEPMEKRQRKIESCDEQVWHPLIEFSYRPPLPVPPPSAGFGNLVSNELEVAGDCIERKPLSEEIVPGMQHQAANGNGDGRRQSKRKGSTTARVVEALADGSLTTVGRPRAK